MHDLNRLRTELIAVLGADAVSSELEDREAMSADAYSRGATCAMVIRSRDRAALARAVAMLAAAGVHIVPRGGGMSYTGGYTPSSERSVIVDLAVLDRIVEINPDDMYLRVESGCTWQQIHAALQAHDLRLPCFGTFSGARATVGGGLSNGALFMGSARFGTVADSLLGLEVLLADGTILRTGQLGFAAATKPFYRTYGPDLTGLFVHDAGAFGIKLEASFRLIRRPAAQAFASVAFGDLLSAAHGLSAVGRSGFAEEAYVFDPESTRRNLEGLGLADSLGKLAAVFRSGSSIAKSVGSVARVAVGGLKLRDDDIFSLHMAFAGDSEAAVAAQRKACLQLAREAGGREMPAAIPEVVRADPFPAPDAVLGHDGSRWAALNAKVAHSDAERLINAASEYFANRSAAMKDAGVTFTQLLIALSNHAFSYEPVLHWRDEWLPIHRNVPRPEVLAGLAEPAANPAARALVAEIRRDLTTLFAAHGAASNQIGRTYPYAESLLADNRRLLKAIRSQFDAQGAMNRGALGL